MAEVTAFAGFPTEGVQFLAELAQNNHRDWFVAHKKTYEQALRAPALAFIATLGEELKAIAPGIRYDLRTNGAGSLMRINRDTRFSADKTPYKDHVDMLWWAGNGRKTENPAFGFRLTASEAGLMVGMHGFPKPVLAAYRDAVAGDELGPALVEAITAVKAAGDYPVGGEHYKRIPQGYAADHPRADLLRYAALYAYAPTIDLATATSPDLVGVCVHHFRQMAPIYHWLVRLTNTINAAP